MPTGVVVTVCVTAFPEIVVTLVVTIDLVVVVSCDEGADDELEESPCAVKVSASHLTENMALVGSESQRVGSSSLNDCKMERAIIQE